jgi:hypothetical protein
MSVAHYSIASAVSYTRPVGIQSLCRAFKIQFLEGNWELEQPKYYTTARPSKSKDFVFVLLLLLFGLTALLKINGSCYDCVLQQKGT